MSRRELEVDWQNRRKEKKFSPSKVVLKEKGWKKRIRGIIGILKIA